MLDLIAELSAAKNLLEVALDRYLGACAAIQTYYSQCSTPTAVPKILSDCVAGEVASISSYELKIKQARSTISQARNCSTTLTPIHTLPSEILTRIFLLVVGVSCGVDVDDSKSRAMPRYPDFLSHVCSRWRCTALDLSELWTHIDLVYYHSSSQSYVDRAEVFVARAGQLPLDVHVRIPASQDYNSGTEVFHDLLSSIMKRIASLTLASPKTMDDFDETFYEFLFDNLEPAGLLHLHIADHSPYAPEFIYAPDHPSNEIEDEDEDEDMDDHDNIRLAVAPGRLEELLLNVKFLQLDGVYFRWASQAYHGLVELHLDQPLTRRLPITALELCTIFTSSPKLVTLRFALDIIYSTFGSHTIPPVYLEHLEVLDLRSLSDEVQLGWLLSLIAPGPRPLQLAMRLQRGMGTLSNPNSPDTQFFKRSNVTRLCIGGEIQELEAGALLASLPRLQVLALQGFQHCRLYHPALKTSGDTPPPIPLRVDTIYFHGGHYDIEYLDQLVKSYSIQSVVIWRTQIYRDCKGLDLDDFAAELSARRPIFRHVNALEGNPIEWGFPI